MTEYRPQNNSSLEDRTAALQDEFERLMQELNHNRKEKEQNGDFYEALNNYTYKEAGQEFHKSPTKRLIQHKNTTSNHKKIMKDNIQKGDYSLVYVTGPNKSYVVEPHGGQLNYKLAHKDTLKFYD